MMNNDIKISRDLAERFANSANFTLEEINAAIQELRALLAAPVVERQEPVLYQHWYQGAWFDTSLADVEKLEADGWKIRRLYAEPVPPLIQTLHANGDRIAMEATIAQQAQRIADLTELLRKTQGWIPKKGFERAHDEWWEIEAVINPPEKNIAPDEMFIDCWAVSTPAPGFVFSDEGSPTKPEKSE